MGKKKNFLLLSLCFFASFGSAFSVWGSQGGSSMDIQEESKQNRISVDETRNLGSWELLKNAKIVDLANFRSMNMGQLKSENLIVVFWANWCDSCKRHLLELSKFIKKLNSKKLDVVAVNIDKLQSEAIAGLEFFKKNNLKFRVVYLQDFDFVKKLNISKIPLDLLFDKERRLVAFHVGLSESKYKKFTSAIEVLL